MQVSQERQRRMMLTFTGIVNPRGRAEQKKEMVGSIVDVLITLPLVVKGILHAYIISLVF